MPKAKVSGQYQTSLSVSKTIVVWPQETSLFTGRDKGRPHRVWAKIITVMLSYIICTKKDASMYKGTSLEG